VVIDSGLTRRLQHDPATGMNRLVTVAVSKAAAAQRKGRPAVSVRASATVFTAAMLFKE